MRALSVLLFFSFVLGCASPRGPVEDVARAPAKQNPVDLIQLQTALGMERPVHSLGFSEKEFDSCRTRVKDGTTRCGTRYFSVLNFKLSCRDSEGTVDTVVRDTKPLVSDKVEFQLAGSRGTLQTDRDGYAQLKLVTLIPVRTQRLVITVGKQFLGKEISEVEQLILPNYWCD
jgi:hypothetical protein